MEGVGFPEMCPVKHAQGILRLRRIRIREEDESAVLAETYNAIRSPLICPGLFVPGHVDPLLVDRRTRLLKNLPQSIDQPLLLRLVNYGNIVEHKDILEALLRVHGVSDVN